MDLLDNVIQPYAWGSRTAIASLQGRPTPTATPEAELWMGAHPQAPSRVRRGESAVTLHSAIQAAPERELGAEIARAFSGTLPFLLKVLAAETPLSLQAHPSLDQAREGFARENAAGIPPNAPHRNYKDANHKPELICALTGFDALCGFRDVAETLQLFDLLGVIELEPLLRPLRLWPDSNGLRETFGGLMTLPKEKCARIVEAVAAECARPRNTARFRDELAWASRLQELYPGDPGVIGSLLLNVLHLEPGEAIYLPAGNLHAYLRGVGVEIMASSDNVLRGGCTPKHVDVNELLRVLDFKAGPVNVLRAAASAGGEATYETPSREFRLSKLTLAEGFPVKPSRRGPEILLCTRGHVRIGDVALTSGQSVFISATDPAYAVDGDGEVFRATVGG